jgi:hypothetical protein
VRTVPSILNYELAVRVLRDPIDADSTISTLEEKIRRIVQTAAPTPIEKSFGPSTPRGTTGWMPATL